MTLTFKVLSGKYGVAQLPPDSAMPRWASAGGVFFIGRTPEELSVICEEQFVPDGTKCERGWRCLEVVGPFPLNAVGIAAEFTSILAASAISVLVVSTYNTDYVLLRESALERAIEAIVGAGHSVLH